MLAALIPVKAGAQPKIAPKLVKYQEKKKGPQECDNCLQFVAPSSSRWSTGRSIQRAGANSTPRSRSSLLAMPSDRLWNSLAPLANVLGIVGALVALGLVGYFASLGIQIVRRGGSGTLALPGQPTRPAVARGEGPPSSGCPLRVLPAKHDPCLAAWARSRREVLASRQPSMAALTSLGSCSRSLAKQSARSTSPFFSRSRCRTMLSTML